MKTRLGTFIIAALTLFCAALCSAKIVWAQDVSYAILIVGNDSNAEQAKLEKQLITEISRALSQKEGNAYKYPKARASQVLSYHFNQEREKQYCQKQLNIYPEDLLFVGIIELNKRMPQTVVYRIDRIASEKRAAQDIVPRLEEMLSENGGAAASAVKSDASKAADNAKAEAAKTGDKAKADVSKASDKAKADVSKASDKAKQDAAKAADKSKQDAAKAADKAKADAAKTADKAKTNVPNTQDVSTGTSKVKAVITPVSSRTGKPAASSTSGAASADASASASENTEGIGTSQAAENNQVKSAAGVAMSAPNVQTSPNGVWRCQVGAFSDSSHARILVSDLCGKGYPAKVEPIERGDKTLYRVFVGGYETKTDAQSILDRLHHDGYANAILAQISK